MHTGPGLRFAGKGRIRSRSTSSLPRLPNLHPEPKLECKASTCGVQYHPITLAAGWGRQHEKDKDVRHLGYCPGLPRQVPPVSRLSEYIPESWRGGSMASSASRIRDSADKIKRRAAQSPHSLQLQSIEAGAAREDIPEPRKAPVKVQTLKNLRILEFPSSGQRVIVQRWRSGHLNQNMNVPSAPAYGLREWKDTLRPSLNGSSHWIGSTDDLGTLG